MRHIHEEAFGGTWYTSARAGGAAARLLKISDASVSVFDYQGCRESLRFAISWATVAKRNSADNYCHGRPFCYSYTKYKDRAGAPTSYLMPLESLWVLSVVVLRTGLCAGR